MFWGSHGCALPAGHTDDSHVCSCALDENGAVLPHVCDDGDGQGEYSNAGRWPYYGPGTRFFT